MPANASTEAKPLASINRRRDANGLEPLTMAAWLARINTPCDFNETCLGAEYNARG